MGRGHGERPRLTSAIYCSGNHRSRVSLSSLSDPDEDRRRRNPTSVSPPPRYGRDGRRSRVSPSPYSDRNRRHNNNKKPWDREDESSSDDEELKGLTFSEYRRLKRRKLRKRMKNCIWRVTPSPPPTDRDRSEALDDEKPIRFEEEENKKEEDDENKSKKKDESSGSDYGESDDSRKLRRRRSKERSRRKRSYSDSSEDERDDSSDGEDSTSDSEESGRKRSRKSRKRSIRSKRRKSRRSGSSSEENEERKSKKKNKNISSDPKADDANKPEIDTKKPEIDLEALALKEILELQKKNAVEGDDFVGPVPLPRSEGHISYGGALRPGEGDAIAQYVQQGKRIPRRGEVGLSADEIQKFESLGYVMSGSRHQRMNAIRIRKENQVYSAEDKRALAMFNYEEKAKREHKVMADLQRLVQRHIGQDVGSTHDPFAKELGAADG